MKKGYRRMLIFEILVLLTLVLNSFIENILNIYNMIIYLFVLIIIFKFAFGLEKDRHRYTKDTIIEVFIICIVGFMIFYLSGLFIGFYKSSSYISLYSIKTFILPIILTIMLKEYFRYNVVKKSEGSKILYITSLLLFIMLDITVSLSHLIFSKEDVFNFVAFNLLPSIANNAAAIYITKKSGYKPNIFWILIINLYMYFIPIIPNTGEYILAVIRIVFPVVLMLKLKGFFEKEEDKHLETDYNKKPMLAYIVGTFVISILIYFTCGLFRFYAIAIASGSMTPKIYKGDVVIVDKDEKVINQIKVGQVIAYEHKGVVIVHRVIDIIEEDNQVFYYTKGDYNESVDNWAVYNEEIIGVVKFKIPYIGFPTVWLSEI